MRGGIRLRITAIATAIVAAVLIVTGVVLLVSQRRILTNNLDEILATNSRAIEHDRAAGALHAPIVVEGDEDAVAQLVGADGSVVAATSNFTGQPALPSPGPGRTEFHTRHLAIDESRYRIMSRSVGEEVIHTGTPIDDVDESITALRTGLVATIPAVALIIGLLMWWLVGRTLRPVELIRAEVAGIDRNNLDHRVPEPAANDEIARLARTMNEMLARVEEAAAREHRFVADASHELRSPLTRIRSELEVDLAHPDTADQAATHRSVLEEVEALQQLVADLLQLARDERDDAVTTAVDLDDIVLAEARRLRDDTALHIDTARVSGAQTIGDGHALARVVRNLCDNAARHARSRITLEARDVDGHAEVVVADDGPGIPEHERGRVFERFARIDESRDSARGGSGLGLAITLDIVLRHGGTITVEDDAAGGARFVVSLPAAGDGH